MMKTAAPFSTLRVAMMPVPATSVAPSADLTARVLMAAPGARAKSRPRRAVWFLGAGWAAAACAGVVAGVGLTRQMSADARADAVLYQATLSGVDDTEVLG